MCTKVCPSPGIANASAACGNGACTFACNTGYSSCNGGCADFSTDENNCGACGAVCDKTCQGGACIVPFGYTPSNFTPTAYAAPSGLTTDCNATYSSTSHSFTTGSCTGAAPTIYSNVAPTGGGPNVDILVFASLTIASGSTLTLTGTNPVILAVYGNATITGTVNASASGTTPGAGGNNSSCVAAAPGTGGVNGASGGGGGGKAVAGGKGSCGGQNCGSPYTIAGGGVSSTGLAGGCAGGIGECGFGGCGLFPSKAGGAGGGAVQISASGTLTGTGSVTANGTAGAAGGTGQNGAGGGGGGSGGYVLLQGSQTTAPSLTLAANGGAGGMASGAGGTAGTNNGTTQVAPGNAALENVINDDGGGGGGAYGFVTVNLE
jgi:hypothetical protein